VNVVISAPGTGAGKTLITQAICAALRRTGRAVQPYKIGPDYIDARFYERVAGRPAYNVDLWLDGAEAVREQVATTRGDAVVAIFEGMMGLYDGDDDGCNSSADVAKVLDAEVVVVLDLWLASQTGAAIALGLMQYDPDVRIAGVILNRVGGAAHERSVRAACEAHGISVLGSVPYDDAYIAADRRLGLDPNAVERRFEAVEQLGERIAATWDLTPFVRKSAEPAHTPQTERAPRAPIARIAYARDRAFWFTYPETLIALREAGAELIPFSPLDDTALAADIDGLWIGGGYPEDFAPALEANVAMRRSIAEAIAGRIPTYAECGGLMYLAHTLETDTGMFTMCGAVAGTTSMREPRLHIGYRTARTVAKNPFEPAETDVRGYEFHYATTGIQTDSPAYRFGPDRTEGVADATLLASFLHRHFLPGSPAIGRFVARCAQ
jgi:cobyrinic acid a,c-diamide synthase